MRSEYPNGDGVAPDLARDFGDPPLQSAICAEVGTHYSGIRSAFEDCLPPRARRALLQLHPACLITVTGLLKMTGFPLHYYDLDRSKHPLNTS